MVYDKLKLIDLIERLENIKEYDYINFCNEDEKRLNEILISLEKQVEEIEELQQNNFSY